MEAKPLPSLPMGPVCALVGPPHRPDTQLWGRSPTGPLPPQAHPPTTQTQTQTNTNKLLRVLCALRVLHRLF